MILNLFDRDKKQAVKELEIIVEETQDNKESLDCQILTNSYEVSGAILQLIYSLELEHRIELGGKIYVTIE
jgi:hypothetical protein